MIRLGLIVPALLYSTAAAQPAKPLVDSIASAAFPVALNLTKQGAGPAEYYCLAFKRITASPRWLDAFVDPDSALLARLGLGPRIVRFGQPPSRRRVTAST